MNPRIKALKEHAAKRAAAARTIAELAQSQGRMFTPDERDQVKSLLDDVVATKEEIDAAEALDARIAEVAGGIAPASGGLLNEFKSNGWEPGKRASVPFRTVKAATFSGDLAELDPRREEGAPLGADKRFLHDAFPSVPVDATTTSIKVLRQASRTLATPAQMRRAIDATTPKPETDSERALVDQPLEQIASVESGIPNIILASDGFADMVQGDLRLAYLLALDDAVAEAIAADASETAAGTDLYQSIRRAITEVQDAGYNPTAVGLSPADAEDLDLFRTEGPEAQYYHVGTFAPNPFSLRRIVSPAIADPIVFDPGAAGKLHVGPVSLATFEEADTNGRVGATNTSLVRLEGNAAFAVQRPLAITRITVAGS